ncbi:uncharacterized protein LOC123672859 [Harmonia axyridis]|uniref:uncharacterized protein LOC123672859 n=1 Tax=Harmonia axyridis TaxID=115357 RepID=UPI001E2758B8|nr:uncharacterized protein LOC123672859 [Harmonia axyridis]
MSGCRKCGLFRLTELCSFILFNAAFGLIFNDLVFASECRFPGAPAHSSITFSDEDLGPGTVATYTCERGFELLGPSRRVCQNGDWLPEGIPFCVLNVAAGKAPMQTSTEGGGIPQKAIDGSTSGFFNADTCTLTKPEKTPWWYVNLLEPYMVQLVRLDFGKECCGGTNPATIVVRVGNNRPDLGTNPVCNRFTGFLEVGQPLFLPCNPPMPGAFVSVHLETPSTSQLSICEAFVYTDQALPIERCPQFRDQPPGSTATYNGKCYIFYNRQPLKFREALNFCKSRGGTLVDESNPALQGFISWELWRRHRSDASGQYWMGAVRNKDLGTWQWLRGDHVTVSFWNTPIENGDCARYDGTKGWLWSDTDCNMHLNYICQHQPKACGRPEQPPNSTMLAENFDVGTTIEYECDKEHILVGRKTRTCLETGFYDAFPPTCRQIQCGYPADIANGEYSLVNDSVGYLSRVVYKCDEGYRLVNRAELICDVDARWNGPPPRCELIECSGSLEIENGHFELINKNETVFGTIVRYTCTAGYKLVGPRQITCLSNEQYDALPPTCQEDGSTPLPTIATKTTTKITKPPTSRRRTHPPRPTTIRAEMDILKINKTTRRTTPRTTKMPSTTTTTQFPQLVIAGHPQDNEIAGSSNIQRGEAPNVNVPLSVDGERREPLGAKLNLGAVIALGAFGAFIFLAAIITTIIVLVKRNHSAKHYRHRASPDCNTVASFDSSSSESRNGLNRYYRQAWENLHESAGSKSRLNAASSSTHPPQRRSESMDDQFRNSERQKDGSELVVNELFNGSKSSEKKRHHHHHHHHQSGKDPRPPPSREHRRY